MAAHGVMAVEHRMANQRAAKKHQRKRRKSGSGICKASAKMTKAK